MTIPRDPDEILAAWLDEGPTRLPDQTRRAIAVALPTTSQRRRAIDAPWRSTTMSTMLKLASGAVAVIAVVLGGAFLLGPPGGGYGVGSQPTPSTEPTPSTDVSPLPTTMDTTGWTVFTSDRYGFSMAHPGWATTPSTRPWSLATDQRDWRSLAADTFVNPSGSLRASVFAVTVPEGMTSDEWIAAYLGPDTAGVPNPCTPTSADLGSILVDGHPATFWREPETESCGGTYAFVPVGDRVFSFTVWRGGNEPLLKAFLSTVRFAPDSADPSASPSASPGAADGPIDTSSWGTYDSSVYGFSIGHPADWTIRPATRAWSQADATDALSVSHEDFRSPDDSVRVSVWSIPLTPGTTIESTSDIERWASGYCREADSVPCSGARDRDVPLCNERRDCHPGLLVPFHDDVQAYFTGGNYPSDHMVVVAVWRGETDASVAPYGGSRRLLEAFLSTMNVWTAPTASPGPS